MSRLHRALLLLILAETAIVAAAAINRARQERPPQPNLTRLDAATANEIVALRTAVKSDAAASWQNLGDGYLAFGYFAEAEACYRHAADTGTASHDLLLRWAVCFDRLGRLPQAIEKYEQAAATEEGRRREVCRYHLGRCHLRNSQTDLAREALRQAGDFELAQYELARLETLSGRPEAALPIVDRLLAKLPDDLKLNLLRARLAEADGDPAGARRWRALAERAQDRLFVDSTVEYIGLLRVRHGLPRQRARAAELETAGQFVLAADALVAAQRLEFDLMSARRLVRLYFRLGRIDEATVVLQDMLDRFGESPEFREQLGDAAYLQQRAEDAAALWQRSVELRPSARVHQLLAEHCRQSGQPQAATGHTAAMEYCQGLDIYRSNEVAAAVEHFARAAELQPDLAEAWLWLGLAQEQLEKPEAARAALSRCLQLQPHQGRAIDAMHALTEAEPAPTP
ncbi:MAG: tetratricopeptide repeat protein [Planctomycetaceae bacterium]|nr:tetratricopeptide repeat protein [Planctomycetaceae bacterium]